MTDHKAQPLSATTFEPAPLKNEAVGAAPTEAPSRSAFIGLAVAAVLLLFVFFVLPQLVGEADPETPVSTTQSSDASPATAPLNTANPAGVDAVRSPFAEAQESALRREAQEVLQSLLTLQESLADRGAARWGEATYQDALESAATGDAAYRERRFEQATEQYQRALEQLTTLESSLPTLIEALHGEVVSAIESGDVLTASARFDELGEMAPADIRLLTLEERLAALPSVIASLEAASSAESAGDLRAAVAAATSATRADPLHQRAEARLSELSDALTRQRFTTAMTQGYGALNGGAFDEAETQFRTAARLLPGAPEPASALAELDQARTQRTLLDLKDRGAAAERAERWDDAIKHYQQALEIDALVLFATEGVERATPRADLDARLEKIPAERDRLIDARIMGLAQQTLAEAEAIVDPGPRLQSQITAARETIGYAATPVSVTLTSDGDTDITLLRVRRLGTVAEQVLSLRPGVYTAVGVRTGYRDVRVKFEVRPGQTNTVDVRCVEAI